jgi:NAD(P)-dependent dehydrogenase (short-subunit alcohol dehydrogenase family)
MMSSTIAGKVVLITGAGKGIGKKLALALCQKGAIVAANDITPINVDPVVEECRKNGGIAKAYIHDIAKKVDLQTMVNNLVTDQGRIDVLINTANVNFPGKILEIDEWDLHRIFEVNAIGTLLTIQSVGRVMRAAGNGMIINCAQIKSDSTASYIASRSGLNNLQSALVEEFTAYGIKVVTTATNDPFQEILAFLT